MKKILLFVAFAALAFLNSSALNAQEVSSKGKEFYLGFMPNFHSANNSDSLYIFIGAETTANVKIEYYNRYGQYFSKTFTISNPSQIYTFGVSWDDYEISGAYNNIKQDSNTYTDQDEKSAKNVFHITSDQDLTVYAHSQATKSAEAFTALPVTSLGDEYYVLTYNSDLNSAVGNTATPSQFLIVATEDSTIVNIYPSSPTKYNNTKTQTITLNKGAGYLVQSLVTNALPKYDLTGTFIKANKNIAVFAGHQRSGLPLVTKSLPFNARISRDCLMEQLPPVGSWGENAFVAPFTQPSGVQTMSNDIYRVLASNDSTKLTINGAYIKTLSKGQFYEAEAISSASISADKPILVALFKKFSQITSDDRDGDPLMLIIPPAEQFLTSYRFINIQADYDVRGVGAYHSQYVTIIVADSSRDKVVFDGTTLSPSIFTAIPYSKYYYTNKTSSDGIHSISCATPIGIFVYGFGFAVSYGYVGGMSFVSLDLMAPRITSILDCFTVTGKILENAVSDKGIKTINKDSIINVNLNIPSFSIGDTSVAYTASLNNIYQDGSFVIKSTDKGDLASSTKVEIPGFTLSSKLDQSVYTLADTVAVGKNVCTKITIYNYGAYNQTIKDVSFKNNNIYSLNTTFPLTIAPKDSAVIEFCYSSTVENLIIDSLIINSKCASRLALAFSVFFTQDSRPPALDQVVDSCGNYITLNFSDTQHSDLGIQSTLIDTVANLSIAEQTITNKTAYFKLERIDPTKDSYIKVTCTDSAAHVTTFEKYIQGFTISILGLDSMNLTRDFDTVALGSYTCDTLTLNNYGVNSITLLPYMFQNTVYSIPPSQLPLTLASGQSARLAVCFAPNESQSKKIVDTLSLTFHCTAKLVKYQSYVSALVFSSSSDCDADVSLRTIKADKGYTLSGIYPNPVSSSCVVKISSEISGAANISLYDIYGRKTSSLLSNQAIQIGDNSLDLNIQNASNGTYLLEVDIAGKKSQKVITIMR